MKKSIFVLFCGITLIGNTLNGSQHDHNLIIDHLKSMTPEKIRKETQLTTLNQKLTIHTTKYTQLKTLKNYLEIKYGPTKANKLFLEIICLSVADARQGTKDAQQLVQSLLKN